MNFDNPLAMRMRTIPKLMALVWLSVAELCQGAELRIIELRRVDVTSWRVEWNSAPGLDYQVQRSREDRLPVGPEDWVPLATVRASDVVTGAGDLVGAAVRQRYYRVVQLPGSTSDTIPPLIFYGGVEPATLTSGANALRVRFSATDNVGVSSVAVKENGTVLGQAVPAGGDDWILLVPANVSSFQARLFSATATDPSGNTADSNTGGVILGDPDYFVPLDTNGVPREGRFLSVIETNQVRPFLFRPGGRPRPGEAPDLFLRFPEGANIQTSNGETTIQFSSVSAGFEPGSPFSLTSPLTRTDSAIKTLRVGTFGFGDLANLFGLNTTNGLALRLFDRFPLRWRNGTIDDRGWLGAQFLSEIPALPLGDWSESLPGLLLDFARERTFRVPLSGEIPLGKLVTGSPTVKVAAGNPLWLTLRPDGRVNLAGPVELQWPNGQNVRADLRLEDPNYCLALAASGLRVQAANDLVDLLPANPAGCVPGEASAAQLAQATRCLESFARAYANFSALVASSASNAPISAAEPPSGADTFGSALEAWGFSALAGPAQVLPLDAIAGLLDQFGNKAGGSPEIPEVLTARLALTRARAALQLGGANGSPATRALLDDSLAMAETAALIRARDPGTVLSLASMKEAARLILETEAVRQQANLPTSPFLEELPGLFTRFAEALADRFGVRTNVFDPSANPAINTMNRFIAIELLRDIIDVQANGQSLGLDLTGTRLDELTGQIGLRLLGAVNADLDAAESAGEFPAFMLAAQDLVELASWAQLGLFPAVPALSNLSGAASFNALANRINNLATLELDRPFGEMTLGRQAHEIRAYLRVLRQIPASVTFAAPAFRRAYDQLEMKLGPATSGTGLAAIPNSMEVLELLEAGLLDRELGARFGFPQTVSWENTRLPLVLQRLAELSAIQGSWRELDRAVRLLVEGADRAGNGSDQTLRRTYLLRVASVLEASRAVARGLLANATGALRVADMALPGDLFIDQPAGYACYDRFSQELHGAVRGRLRLPKFGLSLTVPNASFDSRGGFDLSAFGFLNFDGGQLSVPARQPLHIWNRPDRGLAFEGGARLALSNGMRFDASVSLVDPRYSFALSARGLELDLGKQLILQRPVLAPNALANFSDVALDAVADYLHELSASLETVANAAVGFPPVDESSFGQPPEFAPIPVTLDFTSLNAWSGQIIALTRAGLTNTLQSLNPVLESIERLNQDARAATNALGDEIGRLANLAMRMDLRLRMKEAADLAAGQQAFGTGDIQKLNDMLLDGARSERDLILQLLTPDLPDRLADSLDMVRTLYGTEVTFQSLNDSTGGDATLPGDPCTNFLAAGASFIQRAEALGLCAVRRKVESFGLNPVTGAVADTNRFQSFSESELQEATTLIIHLEEVVEQQGGDAASGEMLRLVGPMIFRQRELQLLELTNNPDLPLERQVELSWLLMNNAAMLQTAGFEDEGLEDLAALLTTSYGRILTNHSPAEFDRAKKAAGETIERRERNIRTSVDRALGRDRAVQIAGTDDYQPDFLTQLNNFFRILGMPAPDSVQTNMDAYVRFKVAELRARPFTPDFLTNRLAEAKGLASLVIGLTDWAGFRMTNDFSVLTNLQLTLSNFTFSITQAAELQKAWWILGQYERALRQHAEIYGSNLVVSLNLALKQSRDATVLTQNRLGDAFAGLINSVSFEDVIVPLPGGVDIERIAGRLFFNRETGFLQGCFGGRVRFSDVSTNLFFEINDACLANTGAYSIDAQMGAPLPFGQAKLLANVAISGTPAGVATFAGGGTLAVPNPPMAERVFDVSLSYDQLQRRLRFDAQGSDLDLRLADDFVIFGAGIGFDLSTGAPEGSFRVSGSAGMFAKQKPLPAVVGPANFHLSASNLTTAFAYSTNAFAFSLSNGVIRLPDIFHNGLCATNPGLPSGPQVALVPSNPLTVRIENTNRVSFSGAIDFRNLGFNVPGLTNLGVEVCSTRLAFRSNALPALQDFNASLLLPLPGQTSIVDVTGVDWALDGFPMGGTFSLRNGVRLLNLGGFTLDLQTNSSFALEHTGPATVLTLAGGIIGTMPGDLLTDAETSAAFRFGTSGSLRWETGQLPAVTLAQASFGARLKLGGNTGFALVGVDANGIPQPDDPNSLAMVTLEGLDNLMRLSEQTPFEIRISGGLGGGDFIFFGLNNARFVFDGIANAANTEPQFRVSSIGFREGEQLKLLGQDLLPFRLTDGSIRFLNDALPLNQLFNPQNLEFTFSGEVNVSLAPPDNQETELPRLFGSVNNVIVSLPNGFLGAPRFSLNGFTLLLENLKIGDIAGLSGGLSVGNLNNPEQLFFAGLVGGEFNGVGIKAIVAARPTGLLGLCLAVNAGPAGIPLDGGTLGGILLTGAEGGVSFLNQFADPCDFTSFLQLADDGTPPPPPIGPLRQAFFEPIPVNKIEVLTWDQLHRLQRAHDQRKAAEKALGRQGLARALAPQGSLSALNADVPCPTGDCPPATLNLLCQRHPSLGEAPSAENYNGEFANTVIFKFTSLGRETVDQILAAANINLQGSDAMIATNFANGVRGFVNSLIPRPPASLGTNQVAINDFIDGSLDAMREAVIVTVRTGLSAVPVNGSRIEALYKAAYAGVPCADITIQLKGTFSYAPISVALSAQGGAVASTTGTAGILGSVNLFGVPVGTGEFFYSLTDTNGDVNPSLCGGVRVALGPLEFGQMGLLIECPSCFTGTLDALAMYVRNLSQDLAGVATPIVRQFARDAAGRRLGALVETSPITAFFGPPGSGALLLPEEQVAVLARLLNLPDLLRFLQQHPTAISEFSQDAINALSTRTFQLVLGIYNAVNPTLSFCGEVQPKIFGFSLTGGNTLLSSRLFMDKTNIRGDTGFSPSYIFGNLPFILLSSGSINNVVPAIDQATMGFSFGLPQLNEPTLQLLLSNPLAFAAGQLGHIISHSTVTFGYQLSPFGFKLADGQGRIILPTLEDHPTNPTRPPFVPPTAPDRPTLLKAALDANMLARATWSGSGSELAALFPQGSTEANNAANRQLVRDYFPHGGFIGAAKVQFPTPLTDLPPFDDLAELFSPLEISNLGSRLDLAQRIFTNYVMGSHPIGELSLYVPFPNPPAAFWTAQQGPDAFIKAIAQADVDRLIAPGGLGLYPAVQFFMRGNVNVQLLGLPLGEGELIADPAQGLFRLAAGIPANSWLNNFVQGSLVAEIRTAEYIARTDPNQLPPGMTPADMEPEARLNIVSNALKAAFLPGTPDAQKMNVIGEAINRITDTLPKASVAAALNLQLPPEVSSILKFNSGAGFFAFSPRFEPDYATPGSTNPVIFPDPDPNNPGPYTLARRNGGIVAIGNFDFGFNLGDPDPNKHLIINVPEMALGITPPTGDMFPSLNGRVRVDQVTLPNVFAFNGASTPPFQFSGLLQFNSSPAINADFLNIDGSMSPINLGPFLSVTPLPANANPQNRLGGQLRVTRTTAGASLAVRLNAARARVPLLGTQLAGTIFGTTDGTSFTPFTFSTAAGQPWNASMRLEGKVEIRSPLDPTGPVLFSAEPLMGPNGPIPFLAELDGVGLQQFEIRLTIPNGLRFTLFPGTDQQSVFETGDNSATCLFVNSNGRIYFDSGTRTLDLNGAATIEGRIEFGFEPVDRTPILSRTSLGNFVTTQGHSTEQTMNVSNSNSEGGQLVVDASLSDTTHFSVFPHRLILGPKESGQFRVRFTPRMAGTFRPNLVLSNNTAQPVLSVPLTGLVTTAPRMHVHLAAINFGASPLGMNRGQPVRISNLGDGALTISAVKTTSSRYTASPAAFSVPAGSSRDIMINFNPNSTAAANATLTFNSNDPGAPTGQVTLTGSGSNRFWYRQRRGFGLDHLTAIESQSDGGLIAVGRDGALLRQNNGEPLWAEDFNRAAPDQNALVFLSASEGYIAAEHGLIYRTANGGASWTVISDSKTTKSTDNFRAAALVSAGKTVALAGESSSEAVILTGSASSSFNRPTLPKSGGLRGIAFGSSTVGVAVGDQRTILRTIDGGKTWSLIAAPASVPSSASLRAVIADPNNANIFIAAGDNGLIIRSTNAGASWTVQNSQTTENLHALARTSTDYFAAGDNGVVRRSSTGTSWSADDAQTSADFRGLTARAAELWAVSRDGDVFHRLSSPISGPLTVVSTSDLSVGSIPLGEQVLREVYIANEGTEAVTAGLKLDNDKDFQVFPNKTQSIPPGCLQRFVLSFQKAGGGSFGANISIDSSDSKLTKLGFQISVINRSKPDFLPLGFLHVDPCLDLGTVVAGTTGSGKLSLRNLGLAELNIQEIGVRNSDPNVAFSFKTTEGPLAPDPSGAKEQTVEFEFSCREPGLYRGLIEIRSDARNGVTQAEYIINVVSEPNVIVVDTIPRGLSVVMNGSSLTTPAAITVVPRLPVAGQVASGSTVTLAAASGATVNGVPYSFQRWEPGSGATMSFVAGGPARRYVARYAPGLSAIKLPDQPKPFVAPACRFATPDDVAFGPWVKISQARLTIPTLGDGPNGAEFNVTGALFLSLTRAYGSLESSRIRVLVPPNSPAFSNSEVLEITPGAWNFNLEAGLFQLMAQTPGLQIFNTSTLPPSTLALEINVRTNLANRRAMARFTTRDELPLAPGLFALGPGAATMTVGLNPAQPNIQLGLNGSIRALAVPNSNGWVINRPYNFNFNASATIAPITFATRTQLADLGIVRFFAQPNAQIGPVFNGSTFSLVANNLGVDFFRSGETITGSLSFSGNGTFSMSASLPTSGIGAGIVRLKPQSPVNRTAQITANPFEGRLTVGFPALFANSTANVWPADSFAIPGFDFDSENFSLRIPLPGVSFAGLTLNKVPEDEDNYFEFSRRPDETRVKLRNELDLILGALKLDVDISSSGAVSGELYGRLGLEGPPPLDLVSDTVSLTYESGRDPEFILNRFFLGAPTRISYGKSAPFGVVCLLEVFTDKPLSERKCQ